MSANQAAFPIAAMARALGVSETGYHAWRRRPPSVRAMADEALLRRIRTVHAVSRGTYGAPRVHAELRAEGRSLGRKRVARLMRGAGLAGVSRRKGTRTTTRRDAEARPAPDLVERDFTATAPDRLWVADITYIPTWTGFLYLAVVLDAFSRRVVGWAMANHLRADLVLAALDMAIGRRQPDGVIHHSDQGSQPGLNWSSQRQPEPLAALRQRPRRAFSTQGSCEVWC
jgi:putative transposase